VLTAIASVNSTSTSVASNTGVAVVVPLVLVRWWRPFVPIARPNATKSIGPVKGVDRSRRETRAYKAKAPATRATA